MLAFSEVEYQAIVKGLPSIFCWHMVRTSYCI